MKQLFRRKRFYVPALFVTLTVLFFVFLFDPLLCWGLERAGTALNGARVDIAKVRTSFFDAELAIHGIEVTDRSEPMKNLVALDKVQLRLLARELFRRKVVVENAAVLGLRYGTARRTSGAVAASSNDSTGFYAQWTAVLNERVDSLKSEFSFASLESLLGFDPKDIPKLGDDSAALRRLREVSSEIESVSDRWQKQLATLPDDGALSRWKAKAEGLKKKPANPQEIAAQLKAAQELRSELVGSLEKVKVLQTALANEAGGLGQKLSSVDQALEQDLKTLRGKLKLPSLNFKDLSATLFGDEAQKTLNRAFYWIALARKYMPSKDGKEATASVAPAETGYPKFLLMKGEVSSDVSSDPTQGRFRGTFANFTSNPKLWGKPATFTLEGALPARQIDGIRLSALFDHTKEVARDEVQLDVAALPVTEWTLSESKEASLRIEKANLRSTAKFGLVGSDLTAKLNGQFREVAYTTKAQNPQLAELLAKTARGLTAFAASVTMEGPVTSPRLSIQSDLGSKLADAIQLEFKQKIAALNERLRKEVQGAVDERKRQLVSLVDTKKDAVLGALGSKVKSIESTTQLAEAAKAQLEKETTGAVKSQISKGADAAKQKLKLPRF